MRPQQKQHHQTHHSNNSNYRCSRALCCSGCRLSVSSSSEAESGSSRSSSSFSSERFVSVSSLAHAMVQERLDQLINQRPDPSVSVTAARRNNSSSSESDRRRRHDMGTKFVLMVAVEKRSDDPGEDFRESMVEMITSNRIRDPRDLRSLLNYYVSMNPVEFRGVILEVFHQVCSALFLYSRKSNCGSSTRPQPIGVWPRTPF